MVTSTVDEAVAEGVSAVDEAVAMVTSTVAEVAAGVVAKVALSEGSGGQGTHRKSGMHNAISPLPPAATARTPHAVNHRRFHKRNGSRQCHRPHDERRRVLATATRPAAASEERRC